MCSDKAGYFVIKYLIFRLLYKRFHLFILVEPVKECRVDGFVHPLFGLFGTMVFEVSVFLSESDIVFDIFPYVLYS